MRNPQRAPWYARRLAQMVVVFVFSLIGALAFAAYTYVGTSLLWR